MTEKEKKKAKSEQAARAGHIGGSRNTAKQQEQRRNAFKGVGQAEKEKAQDARETIRQFLKGRHKRPAYTRSDILCWRLADYIAEARANGRPLTETGLIVALRIDSNQFKKYANGERDYILIDGEAIEGRETDVDINIEIDKIQSSDNGDKQALYNYLYNSSDNDITVPLFSDCIQKARLLVTLEREERLAISGKVSDIFTMKAREGWQDERTINNNILQITTSNANEALQLLGYKQITDD